MAPTRELMLVLDGGPETDVQEIADLTTRLRDRLLELDIDRVELVRSPDIPAGAKPVDAITVGALAITLTPGLVKAVLGLLEAWVKSRPVRGAKVTIGEDSIELTRASVADQERLTQAFIERHTKQ